MKRLLDVGVAQCHDDDGDDDNTYIYMCVYIYIYIHVLYCIQSNKLGQLTFQLTMELSKLLVYRVLKTAGG